MLQSMQLFQGNKAKRIIALALFALALIQVLPSLADVLNIAADPTPSVSSSPAPTESSSPDATPSVATSEALSAEPAPTSSVIYMSPSPSDTATPEPELADDQKIITHIPARLPVDPRATSAYLAPVTMYSKHALLVCFDGQGVALTLNSVREPVAIEGNGTTKVRISGLPSQLNQIFSSGHGIALAAGTRISGKSVGIKALALTMPSTKEDFCGEVGTSRTVLIQAIGLGLNTVKNPVKIN
jgi:hypothetical protein